MRRAVMGGELGVDGIWAWLKVEPCMPGFGWVHQTWVRDFRFRIWGELGFGPTVMALGSEMVKGNRPVFGL